MILVFGAGGQLGQELTAMAAADGTPLAGLTHADADIAETAAVGRALDAVHPTLIINAAAYNAVDRAESEPDAATRANAHGPAVLAAACSGAGVPLVHISTDYVFDGAKSGAYRETDTVHPFSVYAKSKAAGEAAVRRAAPRHLIVRTAWLYGVYGANFVKTMLKLAGERDELNIVSDQHGSPTGTSDLARGLLDAAAVIARGERPWGTYHLAGTGDATRYAMVVRIAEALRARGARAARVNAVASRDFPAAAKRPPNSVLDSAKFAATFGFRARDWREGLDATLTALLTEKAPA